MYITKEKSTTKHNKTNMSNTANITGLCIPKVHTSISSTFIKSKLSQCNFGTIKQYTELPWKNDPTQKRILIRVDWNKTLTYSTLWQEQLRQGNPLRIVYQFPNEWKIYLAKN